MLFEVKISQNHALLHRPSVELQKLTFPMDPEIPPPPPSGPQQGYGMVVVGEKTSQPVLHPAGLLVRKYGNFDPMY